MDAPKRETLVNKPANPETKAPFDGAVAVWDFWLRRLYLEALTELDRRRLD
ncbi:MAG: hypothetical protein OEM05_10530 [Myxococcales bacterium]|nr:hypothetical protein [Myxococcales bacterium]